MSGSLEITHLPTGASFKFSTKGLKIFNESYSSSWNPETAFGRMDPLLSFSSTQRKIGFEIALTKKSDKIKAASIARVMYPTYSSSNALSIKEPPIVRISFENLIQGQNNKGLICAIESLSVDRGTSYGGIATGISPNQIILQFDVIPLHEYDMGWFEVERGEKNWTQIYKKANSLLEPNTAPYDRVEYGATIYQFGTEKLEEIAFSSRKLNQIWSGKKWYSTKKKK